jgi:hypothetical protein
VTPSTPVSPRQRASLAPAGHRIAAYAARQGGVIARFQLLREGVDDDGIAWRLASGTLHRVHPGVYAVGHPGLTSYGATWAALLACIPTRSDRHRSPAPRAAAGFWSAAALLGVAPWPPVPQIIVRGKARDLEGAIVRSTRSFGPGPLERDPAGLLFTPLLRTVLDLAVRSSVAELQEVMDRAERRRSLDVDAIEARLAVPGGRGGHRKLRLALEPWTTISDADYRSLLERFSAMVLAPAGLPPHEINGALTLGNGRQVIVDVVFRDLKLALEVDGRSVHDRAVQSESDKERDRELQKLGWVILRFVWRDVRDRPQVVLRDIRAIVAARNGRVTP